MKRAGRIVFWLVTGLSLLLLVATAGVWVRSYWVSDLLHWYDWPEDRSTFGEKDIWCSRGGMRFSARQYLSNKVHSVGDVNFQQEQKPATLYPVFGDELNQLFASEPRRYAALGFQWIPKSTLSVKWIPFGSVGCEFKSLTLPLYFPCFLFAMLPGHFVLRLRRRRRIARRIVEGCCVGCGYDLRASSGRCPECGRDVSSGLAG